MNNPNHVIKLVDLQTGVGKFTISKSHDGTSMGYIWLTIMEPAASGIDDVQLASSVSLGTQALITLRDAINDAIETSKQKRE